MLFHGLGVVVPLVLCRGVALCVALQEQNVALRHCSGLGLLGNEQSTDWPWKQTAAAAWDDTIYVIMGWHNRGNKEERRGEERYLQSERSEHEPTGRRWSFPRGWSYRCSVPGELGLKDTEPAQANSQAHSKSKTRKQPANNQCISDIWQLSRANYLSHYNHHIRINIENYQNILFPFIFTL